MREGRDLCDHGVEDDGCRICFPLLVRRQLGGEIYTFELEREDDGRWLAETRELIGCLAYGETHADAAARVEELALELLAEECG